MAISSTFLSAWLHKKEFSKWEIDNKTTTKIGKYQWNIDVILGIVFWSFQLCCGNCDLSYCRLLVTLGQLSYRLNSNLLIAGTIKKIVVYSVVFNNQQHHSDFQRWAHNTLPHSIVIAVDKAMIPRHIKNLGTSSTLRINQIARQMELNGEKVFKVGFGQSPFPIPPILVQRMTESAIRGEYTNVQGIPELRQAIAKHYSDRDNREITSDDVIVAPGSKELLYLTQLACGNAEDRTDKQLAQRNKIS